jgi:hypothetical protein
MSWEVKTDWPKVLLQEFYWIFFTSNDFKRCSISICFLCIQPSSIVIALSRARKSFLIDIFWISSKSWTNVSEDKQSHSLETKSQPRNKARNKVKTLTQTQKQSHNTETKPKPRNKGKTQKQRQNLEAKPQPRNKVTTQKQSHNPSETFAMTQRYKIPSTNALLARWQHNWCHFDCLPNLPRFFYCKNGFSALAAAWFM